MWRMEPRGPIHRACDEPLELPLTPAGFLKLQEGLQCDTPTMPRVGTATVTQVPGGNLSALGRRGKGEWWGRELGGVGFHLEVTNNSAGTGEKA